MKFNHFPTLQHIALVNVAKAIWSNDDPIEKYFNARTGESQENLKWIDVVQGAQTRASTLVLTPQLKDDLEIYIHALAEQFLAWLHKCFKNCITRPTILASFRHMCFTTMGKIDVKRVTELLLADPNMKLEDRFRLACESCMENEIMRVWHDYNDVETLRMLPKRISLVHYWVSLFLSPDDLVSLPRKFREHLKFKLTPLYQESFDALDQMALTENRHFYYGLYISFCSGCIEGTKYFCEILKMDENELLTFLNLSCLHIPMLPASATMQNLSDCLCYLLNMMSENSQLAFLKRNFLVALRYFIPWPWNSYFDEIMKHVLSEVTENFSPHLVCAFRMVNDIVVKKDSKLYTPKAENERLFSLFWSSLLPNYKMEMIESQTFISTLAQLLVAGKTRNVKIMLNDVKYLNPNYVESNFFFGVCNVLTWHEEWDIFKLFLLENIPHADEVVLKKIIDVTGKGFENHGHDCSVRADKIRNKVHSLLANLELPQKRPITEETDENSKRIKT